MFVPKSVCVWCVWFLEQTGVQLKMLTYINIWKVNLKKSLLTANSKSQGCEVLLQLLGSICCPCCFGCSRSRKSVTCRMLSSCSYTPIQGHAHIHTHTHRRRVNDEKWGKRRYIRVTRWALGGNGKRKRELAGPVGPAVPVTVPAVYIAWSTCINNGNILNQSSECRKMPKRKA